MRLEQRDTCVTDLAFDEWFAEECTPRQRALIEEHVGSCTRCRLRCELLERERSVFLETYPTLAAHVQRVREPRQIDRVAVGRDGRIYLTLAVAALTFAALFAWLPSSSWFNRTEPDANSERRKGAKQQLGFYVKRGQHVRWGNSSDPVYPGDLLRFTYTSSAPTYFALLGLDARGARIYFQSRGRAVRIEAGNDKPLDFSLELDEQLGSERLFAIFCPYVYSLAPLVERLETSGELPEQSGCRVEKLTLIKKAPP